MSNIKRGALVNITVTCTVGEPVAINGIEATSELLEAVGNYLQTCSRAETTRGLWDGWIIAEENKIAELLEAARNQ